MLSTKEVLVSSSAGKVESNGWELDNSCSLDSAQPMDKHVGSLGYNKMVQ
jgi:hypothetical protein